MSFFTERKFVGYKTDPDVEAYVRDGSWFRAYIGEYDTDSKKLALEPTDAKKVKFIVIALPHSDRDAPRAK